MFKAIKRVLSQAWAATFTAPLSVGKIIDKDKSLFQRGYAAGLKDGRDEEKRTYDKGYHHGRGDAGNEIQHLRAALKRANETIINISGKITFPLDIGKTSGGHDLFKTGDADAPDVIKDRNGEVVLSLCRACNKGEAELTPFCGGEPNGKS